MGKYSNLKADSLLNASNNAYKDITNYDLKEITNTLNRHDVLDSKIGDIIINNLDKVQIQKLFIKCLENSLYKSDGSLNYSVMSRINTKKRNMNSYETKIDRLLR